MTKVVDGFSACSLRDVCRRLIAVVADPEPFKGSRRDREDWLTDAAHRSGLHPRMVKALYYGEIDDPDHEAVTKLKEAAERYELQSLIILNEEVGRRLRIMSARNDTAGQGSLPLRSSRR